MSFNFRLDTLRGDLFGGLTASVVALPLALAFGVASGAGAIAGLYGAIFVGFFAAIFGGTASQVSGPTGPMTVVMTAIVMTYAHEPALAFAVVVMGGAFQIILGVLKLGRYVTFVPFSVISGFMSGIGCIIIILQVAALFGHSGSQSGVLVAIAGLPAIVSAPLWPALSLGLLSLAIMVFQPHRSRKLAPPPLVALIVGTVVATLFVPGVPVIGEIPRGIPSPHWPALELAAFPGMIQSAFVLALLGSIDSLLTSLIADNVTRTHHNSNRELIGQGIGNVIAGMMSGLPGAGATMRTVINVRAGGRTRLSGAFHALVLLALVLGLAPLAEGIPLAVLAGILLKVGWDIIDWPYLRHLRGGASSGDLVMITVLVLTVLVDLITAVGFGIIMASMISASRLSEHQLSQFKLVSSDVDMQAFSETERELLKDANGRVLLLHLSGPFSFCSARNMVHRLASAGADYEVIIFDLTDVPVIDTSVALAIGDLIGQTHEDDSIVLVAGVDGQTRSMLDTMRALDEVPPDRRHDTREGALRQAGHLARATGKT